MNIKLKAGLTVIGFFGGMTGLAWAITNIPEKIIIDIVLGALSVGCLAFAYWVSLDYYKGVEVLKELEKERFERDTDKNMSTSDGQITSPPSLHTMMENQ